MKRTAFALLLLLLVFTIFLTACGRDVQLNEPESSIKETEKTDTVVQQLFEINGEDISKVSISTGPNDMVTGVIETPEDIGLLTQILNTATPLTGDATADYYRLLTIDKMNGSTIELEFGGNGWFFKSLETSLFYELSPDQRTEIRALIEKIEAEH
ncbi:hypothetical protein [Candidatus Pristimantibacillus sp. PTI5]|uniref:hypothetical protein n=1 Tax=Candidatus Pristimantibacillus sp. PTI5 TaxID=3400422 RepID=UPI003B0165EC